jgi:tRNA G18 (ribose-2'-O)-methylase SpoU
MASPIINLNDLEHSEVKDALSKHRAPIEIAVYSSENYFNMGAIIRIAHNFRVNRIYGVDLPKHYKRADMGTRKYEDIVRISLDDFLEMIPNDNIVVFERRADVPSKDIRTFNYPKKPVLFFGSEKDGTPDRVINVAGSVVSIPMFGLHNDHNVSIACGIALYDYAFKTPEYYEIDGSECIKNVGKK